TGAEGSRLQSREARYRKCKRDACAPVTNRPADCLARPLPQAVLTYLMKLALRRFLIRTPAQKPCAVPKPSAGKVIVLNFTNQFRRERLPFRGPLSRPTARPTRCVPGKSGRLY